MSNSLAEKFDVMEEKVQTAIESFAYMLTECYKYNVNTNDLRKIFNATGFDENQVEALVEFVENQRATIVELLAKPDGDTFFYDLQWRFEAKISSRSLLEQMQPIMTINFQTSDNHQANLSKKIQSYLMQTDPNTLIRITNVLEKALQFSQSNAAQKIQKKIRKLVPESSNN